MPAQAPGQAVSQHGPVERWTTRSGIRVRYLDNAPADPVGLPVLFSPGVSDFAEDYLAALEFFRPRRLIVVEVRGRGRSEAPASGYRNVDHARDLAAVIAAEGLTRFHLMTFSRGTVGALELLSTHAGAIASVAIGDYPGEAVVLADWFADRICATTFRGIPVLERIERHVLEALQQEGKFRDYYAELADLDVPVLVAKSEEQSLVTEAAVDRYRATVPGVEVITIPGSRHDIFRPVRNAYPAAIADFLARRASGL
ncbi:alpha/beta fold hydrolase [Frankia gtarii]|uniref:alpha/beta fold hydrolase n=1 Tax=Frankia gtarii TaxID=2950102 RepID=UPI0021C188F4|nr:alpha/beta hydrolase [Frankia gtarii]